MENSRLIKYSFIHSLGVLVYVALVAWVMHNGQKLFGNANSVFAGVAILLLFVVSATIVGLLVLARPITLYLDNQKKDAFKLLFYTIGWLAGIMIVIFALLVILNGSCATA